MKQLVTSLLVSSSLLAGCGISYANNNSQFTITAQESLSSFYCDGVKHSANSPQVFCPAGTTNFKAIYTNQNGDKYQCTGVISETGSNTTVSSDCSAVYAGDGNIHLGAITTPASEPSPSSTSTFGIAYDPSYFSTQANNENEDLKIAQVGANFEQAKNKGLSAIRIYAPDSERLMQEYLVKASDNNIKLTITLPYTYNDGQGGATNFSANNPYNTLGQIKNLSAAIKAASQITGKDVSQIIQYIDLGNEWVTVDASTFDSNQWQANLQTAFNELASNTPGLEKKLTTCLKWEVAVGGGDVSDKASTDNYNRSIAIVRALEAVNPGAALMVNIYPYNYNKDQGAAPSQAGTDAMAGWNLTLDQASVKAGDNYNTHLNCTTRPQTASGETLCEPKFDSSVASSFSIQGLSLPYMYSTAYNRFAKLNNGGQVKIVIGETGWPTAGNYAGNTAQENSNTFTNANAVAFWTKAKSWIDKNHITAFAFMLIDAPVKNNYNCGPQDSGSTECHFGIMTHSGGVSLANSVGDVNDTLALKPNMDQIFHS